MFMSGACSHTHMHVCVCVCGYIASYVSLRLHVTVCMTVCVHVHIMCIICNWILENSSKSHMKSSIFLHVFNDISLMHMYLLSISYILSVI